MSFVVAFFVGLLLSMPVGAEPLVEGRVRLSSGGPAAAAQMLVFDLTALERGPVAQATTDGDGHFALRLSSLGGLGRPDGFALGQNYPNPFNPSTVIPYQLATAGRVRLEVFNVLGQRVATLVDADRSAGVYMAVWDATDEAGRAVGAGVYIYRLREGGASWSRRMVLVDGPAGTAGVGSFGPAVHAPSEQAERSYGLVVSGAGFVPYVDAAFSVGAGLGSVELVVEPVATQVRGKALTLALTADGSACPSEPETTLGEDKGLTCGILGDVNNDGLVDVNDALLVMVFHFDPSITAPNEGTMGLGNVTADGQVNLDDVLVLMTYLTNASDASLPAGIGQATSSCTVTAGDARAELARRGIDYMAKFIDYVRAGNLEVVKLFVTAGWSVDDAMLAAAEGGHLAVMEYLVEQGANLDLEATADYGYGATLLYYAALGGSLAVMEYLVEQGASLEATDDYGATLLHYAAWGGSLVVVEYLVEQGASLEATDANDMTLLHYAAWGGSLAVVEYLIEQGANVEATADYGWTARIFAEDECHSDVAEYLKSIGG